MADSKKPKKAVDPGIDASIGRLETALPQLATDIRALQDQIKNQMTPLEVQGVKDRLGKLADAVDAMKTSLETP